MTAEVRAALATCHTNIGFTLRTRGKPAEALRPYEQAREIQERLARDTPTTPRYQEALSWTLSNIGRHPAGDSVGPPTRSISTSRPSQSIRIW